MSDEVRNPPLSPAGRSVERFAAEAAVGRTSLYTLPIHLQPKSVKIGRRRVIIEAPADWLRRMAASQEVEAA